MTFVEIKKSISDLVKRKIAGIKIPPEDEKEGFEKPAIFISFIPLKTSVTDEYIRNRNFIVQLQYFQKKEDKNQVYTMAETLENIFDCGFHVGDRFLKIHETEWEVIDKVLHFRFQLDFDECIDLEEFTNEKGEKFYTKDKQIEFMKKLVINGEGY